MSVKPITDFPTEPLRVSDLKSEPVTFDFSPTPPVLAKLAGDFDLIALRKLRFTGSLKPQGQQDWVLDADLGATVVQPCRVTLDPVTTRIDEFVNRQFLRNPPEIEGSEVEMPEDDTSERLTETIDIAAVMTEALALALPAFPRAEGATDESQVFTEPGHAPMTDADAKPFAGLATLRDRLKKQPD